jgi:hypothetical protein
MARHEPIVVKRVDWPITKAACSCGAPLQISGDVGSPKEQSEKLVAAFKKHVSDRQAANPKPAARKPREDFSQAAPRIVREATERD